jgi:hypothetical protein
MSQSALLIGEITHARKEWESISSLLTLKVRDWHSHCAVDTAKRTRNSPAEPERSSSRIAKLASMTMW